MRKWLAYGTATILTAWSVIVGDVLRPAGFTFHMTGTGHNSGGRFAAGRFTKGSQYLEVHFRHSPGLVSASGLPNGGGFWSPGVLLGVIGGGSQRLGGCQERGPEKHDVLHHELSRGR